MRRKTFDALLTAGGVLVAIVLVVAGVLLLWAHNFTNDQVRSQLSQQQIFFPAAGSPGLTGNAEIAKYVTPYAGQQVLNGQQAQVFADHYIKVHLSEMQDGGVYAKLSADARANPNDPKLAAAVESVLQGHDTARHAPERLRLLEDGFDRRHRSDRILHRRRRPPGARRSWLLAPSPGQPGGRGAAEARCAGSGSRRTVNGDRTENEGLRGNAEALCFCV